MLYATSSHADTFTFGSLVRYCTMMLPTHALAGMALALPVALAVPELAGLALLAGFVGGILPDLDLYAGHRKTLHYPFYYSLAALVAVAAALVYTSAVTVAVALVLLGAALHSVTDVFGGGLELRPWEGTSQRAVYDHYRGEWIPPRRWVAYDGSPGDLALSVVLAVPLLVAVEGALSMVVLAALTVAVVYTALRRVLPAVAELLVTQVLEPRLPARLLAHVPARYRQQHHSGR